MATQQVNTTGGISCFSVFAILLTCLFVGLKLAEIIAWSWWLVFMPLFVYAGIVVFLLVLLALLVIVSDKK